MTFEHPFLDAAATGKLTTFARIFKERGKMQAITDDALIITTMAMNGVPKPTAQAGDKHKVILFSDKKWSWLVVIYQGFFEGNGLAALKIDRNYLKAEFTIHGEFTAVRAQKIINGLLCIMQVNPRDVEFDWGGFEKKEQQ